MYVRDELGDFSECAYSLLLSYQSSHLPRGGDQQELVTASLRYILLANTTASRETHCVRVIREGWRSLYIIYSSYEMGDLDGN